MDAIWFWLAKQLVEIGLGIVVLLVCAAVAFFITPREGR